MSGQDPSPGGWLTTEYARAEPGQRLPDDALAAVEFGPGTSGSSDPHCIHVNLEPLVGAGLREVWRGSAPIRRGVSGSMRYAEDGAWLAGVIELDENECGGLSAASEAAYRQILEFHDGAEICHLLRTWTFLSRINAGSGDEERYKQFCVGRAKAFAGHARTPTAPQFPAATAVGRQDSTPKLQVFWLAGRAPGRSLENPRQVSAYRYPRQYGPSSPSFSRAMLLGRQTLLLSGTASIVGHVSRHTGDVETQFNETLANIGALLTQASAACGAPPFSIGPGSLIKVYVRDPEVARVVETKLRNELGPDVPLLILAADICREELSLEIEAVLPGSTSSPTRAAGRAGC